MILASNPISPEAIRVFLLPWAGGGCLTLEGDPALGSVAAQEMAEELPAQTWGGINPPEEAAGTQWNRAEPRCIYHRMCGSYSRQVRHWWKLPSAETQSTSRMVLINTLQLQKANNQQMIFQFGVSPWMITGFFCFLFFPRVHPPSRPVQSEGMWQRQSCCLSNCAGHKYISLLSWGENTYGWKLLHYCFSCSPAIPSAKL